MKTPVLINIIPGYYINSNSYVSLAPITIQTTSTSTTQGRTKPEDLSTMVAHGLTDQPGIYAFSDYSNIKRACVELKWCIGEDWAGLNMT